MNAPQTRMQSKPSLVNATASLRPQQTQRSSSLSQQVRIKPPQQHPQTMSRACVDV